MAASGRTKSVAILIKLWLPVTVGMALIFYLSSKPGKDIPEFFPYQDLLYHFLIYAILAFFFSRAVKGSGNNIRNLGLILAAVTFSSVYGLSDELHQIFVPGRTFSLFDLALDAGGSLIGSLGFVYSSLIYGKNKAL